MFNLLSVEITNLVRKQFKYYFIVCKYLIHENTYTRGYNTYTRIHEIRHHPQTLVRIRVNTSSLHVTSLILTIFCNKREMVKNEEEIH